MTFKNIPLGASHCYKLRKKEEKGGIWKEEGHSGQQLLTPL